MTPFLRSSSPAVPFACLPPPGLHAPPSSQESSFGSWKEQSALRCAAADRLATRAASPSSCGHAIAVSRLSLPSCCACMHSEDAGTRYAFAASEPATGIIRRKAEARKMSTSFLFALSLTLVIRRQMLSSLVSFSRSLLEPRLVMPELQSHGYFFRSRDRRQVLEASLASLPLLASHADVSQLRLERGNNPPDDSCPHDGSTSEDPPHDP